MRNPHRPVLLLSPGSLLCPSALGLGCGLTLHTSRHAPGGASPAAVCTRSVQGRRSRLIPAPCTSCVAACRALPPLEAAAGKATGRSLSHPRREGAARLPASLPTADPGCPRRVLPGLPAGRKLDTPAGTGGARQRLCRHLLYRGVDSGLRRSGGLEPPAALLGPCSASSTGCGSREWTLSSSHSDPSLSPAAHRRASAPSTEEAIFT